MKKQKQIYICGVMKALDDKRGVSMVIALALLSVISIIALTSTYVLTNAIRGNTEFGSSIRAEAAADSAIEAGLGALRNKAPGWQLASQDTPMTLCLAVDGTSVSQLGMVAPNTPCEPVNGVTQEKIQYWITSSAEPINGAYIIPPPGEGNAGENCERANNHDDILEPCNWNKLYFGDTVSIPLYTTNAAGDIINPPNLPTGTGPGLNAFTLKVRTPCVDNPYDASGNLKGDDTEDDWCTATTDPNINGTGPGARPELYDATQSNLADNIIVNWQILGHCDYSPDNSHDGPCVGLAVLPTSNLTSNDYSDINIDVINDGKDVPIQYAVIGGPSAIPFGRNSVYDLNTANVAVNDPQSILNYLKDYYNQNFQFISPATTSRTLDQPELTLSVVSPMTAQNAQGQVPYIEYQLQTDQPIADSFWTVHARGSYGNYQISKKAKKQSSTSSTEFVIQN